MSFAGCKQALQGTQTGSTFPNAHDFVVKDSIFITSTISDTFMMKEFEGHTIRDAELDSSGRDPPPRCHPGTRKEIVDRIHLWLRNPTKKWLWLVGQAGVGKSAIMQSVAELELESKETILAALFFSATNGRNDPSKVIITLAYQLAVQLTPYREHVGAKIMANPKLFKKAIDKQFYDFIVEPFVTARLHQGSNPVLIFVDGLDECRGPSSQLRFLDLISSFTTDYPDAPLLWIVASRPESYITNHLSLPEIASTYSKEEVLVNSKKSCEDVERFLRAKLEKIRDSDPIMGSFNQQWPPEYQVLKLCAAALGHFAYADTTIRFISEGNHIAQFQLVLDLIDRISPLDSSSDETTQPLAHLNDLYRHIFSQVSIKDLPATREILTFCLTSEWLAVPPSIWVMCNSLQMTPNVMYSSLRQLHSVLDIPPPSKFDEPVKIYHKSFADFLRTQIPGLPIHEHDELQWHLSRAVSFLSRIPLSSSSEAPKIPQDFLSWPYQSPRHAAHAKDRFGGYLTDLMMFDTKHPISISSNAVHDLKIAVDICDQFPLDLLDHNSELTRLLKEDGCLRKIPIKFLDLADIQEGEGFSLYESGSGARMFQRVEENDIIRLKSVREQSPDTLVEVFIPNRLHGWVDCAGLIDMERFSDVDRVGGIFLPYDFSTAYLDLEGQFEGSSRATTSTTEDEEGPCFMPGAFLC